MDSRNLRKTFLEFFAERGHVVVPSSSLVPDDPTLLLTNAGMVQFKPYFLGRKAPAFARAATVQKCFRAVDLEGVGKTSRHLTFFEMLGNFSFGDYFKTDACRWAWELVTIHLSLAPERLWVTVFETDDEAAEIWEKEVGVPPERILRRGREDNFWDMGVAGPCGPCSELLYDRGESFGRPYEGDGEIDDERYLEVWNLVFMQHLQNDRGEIVGDLPTQNVDTGAGLERIAAILQGVPSTFETDTLAPLLGAAEEVIGTEYGTDDRSDISLRILADHPRAMTMLIADGVLPSNEWRGYVLRRLIRRAVRHARLAGLERPVLRRLAEAAIELFADVYEEVGRNRELILAVAEREEARFDATLRRGLSILETEIAGTLARGETRLGGDVAFELHDTYGFPLDLTLEIAREDSLSVDVPAFEALMVAQRERARAAGRAATAEVPGAELLRRLRSEAGESSFVGYDRLHEEGTIIGLIRDLEGVPVLQEGREGEVAVDRTPFYPEGGGQVGDRGELRTATGRFRVSDTRWGIPGVIVQRGRVIAGEILLGQEVEATVDPTHRDDVRRSHTATHMLHWGLRDTLGEHARQQGSLVEPGRLRFDFSHFEAVSKDLMGQIEEEINARVLVNDAVRAFETTYDHAVSLGAMALFGEKYGDYVRVVEVGDYSRELCGGTHVSQTGQVGVIKILGESSIGAGIRRIECYTGAAGLSFLNTQAARLRQIAEMLKTDPERVVERLERTLETTRELEAELGRQRAAGVAEEARQILASKATASVAGSRIVSLRRDGRPMNELRKLAVAIRERLDSGVVLVASAQDERASLVVAVSSDLVERGLSARTLLSQAAAHLGGGAGGKPDLAMGGGPQAGEIGGALDEAVRATEAALSR
ncbi:MAG: alanine--tRNA ligase [Actinomycetota bacterium]